MRALRQSIDVELQGWEILYLGSRWRHGISRGSFRFEDGRMKIMDFGMSGIRKCYCG